MTILAVNCGSSSVKYAVYEPAGAGAPRRLARGREDSVEAALAGLWSQGLLAAVDMAGHRVVHGGTRFVAPTRIDERTVAGLESLADLAPLHIPPALAGIAAARRVLGDSLPMVAVFDTAFFHALPAPAGAYAVPWRWTSEHGLRRFGFHGLAHRCLAERAAELIPAGRPEPRLVSFQLGSGCSCAALQGTRPVDTSMGFTPEEGLVMATRPGDLDPAVVDQVARLEARSHREVLNELSTGAGLLGLSGVSGDVRELLRLSAGGHRRAAEAMDSYVYRARKYLGAYAAALGGLDVVAFGGGVGENSPEVRRLICLGMEWCGLRLDEAANAAAVGVEAAIAAPGSAVRVFVIPVEEELLIARDTLGCLAPRGPVAP